LTNRPKIYTEYVGLFLKTGTTDKLITIAKARGHRNDEDIFGKKLKQPKKGISITIREIVEEYISRSSKP
jgi:hypothetical protein